jgi:transcriptional regulator with XRE-family HTH domain
MSSFSENLKKLRYSYELSQYEFAKKIDYSQSAVNTWENEMREPGIDALMKISRFFNVTIDYLVGHEHDAIKKYSAPQIVLQDIPDNEKDMLMLFRLLPSDLQKRATDYLQRLVNLAKEEKLIFKPNKKQKNI